MENFLFKKSYQLNTFLSLPYKSLWGANGIFTTIRLYGDSPELILLEEHLKKFNSSVKKFNIHFKLTKEILLNLINPHLNLKKYDHLLRIACNKKVLSISLRKRRKIVNNYSIRLRSYQRPLASLKHLNYKKILSFQKELSLNKEEIVFYKNNSLLEGSTTNIIAVKNDILFIPLRNYYFGITLGYLVDNTKMKIIKQNITINNLNNYSELLLVGSGKEVVSVSSIKNLAWRRTSFKTYKKLKKTYKKLLN